MIKYINKENVFKCLCQSQLTFQDDIGLAQGQLVVLEWHLLHRWAIQYLWFEENAWVLIPDARQQQPFGLGWTSGNDHLNANKQKDLWQRLVYSKFFKFEQVFLPKLLVRNKKWLSSLPPSVPPFGLAPQGGEKEAAKWERLMQGPSNSSLGWLGLAIPKVYLFSRKSKVFNYFTCMHHSRVPSVLGCEQSRPPDSGSDKGRHDPPPPTWHG